MALMTLERVTCEEVTENKPESFLDADSSGKKKKKKILPTREAAEVLKVTAWFPLLRVEMPTSCMHPCLSWPPLPHSMRSNCLL